MNSITGTIYDVHDLGPQIGVDLDADDGRRRHLVADKSNSLTIASINGALAHGDHVELGFDPIPPRLGAPMGRVTHLRVIDHQAEMGHAA